MSTVTLRIIREKKTFGYTIHVGETELPAVKGEGLRSYTLAFEAAQPQIKKLLKRG